MDRRVQRADPLAINNLITGLAFCLCMGGLGSAYERTHAMAWTAVALGAWTIVAPWVIAGEMDTTRTVVNNLITGAVALCLGLAMAMMVEAATPGTPASDAPPEPCPRNHRAPAAQAGARPRDPRHP